MSKNTQGTKMELRSKKIPKTERGEAGQEAGLTGEGPGHTLHQISPHRSPDTEHPPLSERRNAQHWDKH